MTTDAPQGTDGPIAGRPAPAVRPAPAGLRWLSRGLIAYGVVGLLVSAIGLGATVWVNGRIGSLRAEAEATVAQAASTMALSATVLRGASTTVETFSETADATRQAISAAAGTITEAQSALSGLETQLRSVNIFGATPLASSADAVGRIAASMDGLGTQIPLVADDLAGNRDALAANAATLSTLADSTAALAASLRPSPGLDPDPLGDTQQVIAITLLMFAAWSFVPALGALALGLWVRQGGLARGRASDGADTRI